MVFTRTVEILLVFQYSLLHRILAELRGTRKLQIFSIQVMNSILFNVGVSPVFDISQILCYLRLTFDIITHGDRLFCIQG